MSDVTTPELIRAYQLIEADELDQARIVLDSYLEVHRDDADAWWLYAHAVTEPMEAQNALRNVLRLAPDYPGAKTLLSESEQMLTPTSGTAGITRLASRPVPADDVNRVPDFLDRLDADDDDFGDFGSDDTEFDDDFDDEFTESADEDSEPTSRRLQFLLIAALVLVVLIALVWAITGSSRNRNTVTITATVTSPAVVVILTETPTASVEETTEASSTTPETSAGGLDDVYSAMAAFTVVPESAGIESTSMGTTLLISICNNPASGLVTTALNAIETLSLSSDLVVGQAEFAGVRVVDCNRDNLILRTLAVSLDDAQAYMQGSITLNQLRTRVKSIS